MKIVALLTLGCFCVLTSFAYGRAAQWQPHPRHAAEPVVLGEAIGYSEADRAALAEVVARKPSESERATALKQKQAKVLAEVYGITPANAGSYREWW